MKHGGTLDAPTWHRVTDPRLAGLVRAVRSLEQGEPVSGEAWHEASRRAGAPAWPPPNPEAPRRVEVAPSDALLARMALDHAPAAGDDGPGALLGPWLTQLDLTLPAHRAAWTAATAAAAFLVPPGQDRTPLRSWIREPVRRGVAQAEAQAAARTPPCVWRIVSLGEEGARVVPLLPLHPTWQPAGPVSVASVGGVEGPPRVGGVLLGRLVPTHAGASPCACVALPEAPPEGLVAGIVAAVAAPMLAHTPTLTMEDVLRRAGHVVVGDVHRWWWARRGTAADVSPT